MGGDFMNELTKFKSYMLQRRLSPNTIDNYMRDLHQFFDLMGLDVDEVTQEDIYSYMAHLRDSGCAVSSSNRKLSALKTFYKFCVRNGIVAKSPAELIESGKVEKRLPVVLDSSEVDKFINASDSLRDRVIFEILYGTGVRREELISIKVKDINFRRGIIRVIGKGDKERLVPIHPAALRLIGELIKSQDSEWLFPSSKVKGQHMSKRRLNEIVKRYADKLGYEGITPHKFRHSFGTALFENGADIKAIQDMLGHASIDTTNIYAQVSVDRNQKEYLKFHPRATHA